MRGLAAVQREIAALRARCAAQRPPSTPPPGADPEAEKARADPDAWAELFSGQPQAEYHRTLQRAFSDHAYLIVEGPPEVGKSQQLTLRRVLWEIGRNPNATIGIVGAKAEQAYEWVRAIRAGLESPAFRRVFPAVRPGFPWSTERLYVGRSDPTLTAPTVQGIGIGGSFLGARLNIIILDDILNALNTATKAQRTKVCEWIDSSMCAGRLLAGGKLVLLGNTWTSDDAIHELSKRIRPDGSSIYRYQRDPLPDPDAPDAVSPLPEIWPLERIRERRDLIGPARFKWQYELHPRGAEDSRFDPAWFEAVSARPWRPPTGQALALRRAGRPAEANRIAFLAAAGETLQIGVDLGVGLGERHDRTALVVYLRDTVQCRHVIYVETLRDTGPALIERMAVLEASYRTASGGPPVIRVETVAAQEFLAQFARTKLDAPIVSHSTSGGASVTSKAWGVEQLAIRAQGGQVRFCVEPGGRWPPAAAALRDGLLWYSPREHTADEVMALLLAETQATLGEGAHVPPASPARARPTEGGTIGKLGA